jgi:putative oxidoreductase
MPDRTPPRWTIAAVLLARLIFAGLFAMAAAFKIFGLQATADFIAAAGFPMPLVLASCALALEVVLALAFLTGFAFSEAALVAAAYVLFLAFAFHGPGRWQGSEAEFGFFVDHFTFVAGLLFAAAHGPGPVLAAQRGWLLRSFPA